MFKNLKPFFIENSSVPKILSFFAPISIGAISIFPFVFSRGKINEVTRNHETIHFQQQLETGVLFFYIFYLFDFVRNKIKGLSGEEAYMQLRAEREAYNNQSDKLYLKNRKRWAWITSSENK